MAAVGWLLTLGAVVLLVVLPLATLLGGALADGGEALGSIADPRSLEAWRHSILVALGVTALAVLLGTTAALVTERGGVGGRDALRLGMLLPLLVPDFVAALSWLRAYGPGGLTDDLAGIQLPWIVGPLGIIVVLTAGAVPLVYLVVASGLASRAEPELERAARASGAGWLDAWLTVTVPLALPSIGAAAALVMVTTLNAFAIPSVLGTPAGFGTMTTTIYQDLALAGDAGAFTRVLALSLLLTGSALVILGVADWLLPHGTGRRSAAPSPSSEPGRGSRLPTVALWLYLALSAGLPLVALLLTALTRGVGLPSVPANWTLDHFATVLDGRFAGAVGNSLVLAVLSACGVLLLSAVGVSVARGQAGRTLGTLVTGSFALPGTALAVAVLLAYGGLLRDTLWLILVAYLAKFWALAQRPLAGAATTFPVDAQRAARASGAHALTALTTIVLPMLRPVLVAAWLLVFVFALHEVTMSILLYGPGSQTLAVVILNLQQLGDPTVTSALAVLLTLAIFLIGAPLLVSRSALLGLRSR